MIILIITVVSTNEFIANKDKYFDLAMNEQVMVQRGNNMFIVTMANEPERRYKEPDDDLRRAIPMEEVRDSIINYICRKHAKESSCCS